MRFARSVHFQVTPGREKEFASLLEKEVVPTLRRQPGFEHEFTLVNKSESLGISIWNDQKSAEAYNSSTYPSVLAKLTGLIAGTPKVETYDVPVTTLQLTPA